MIHMLRQVLGLHEPQFYGPGYRLGYYTTAQTPLPTGTGRPRLVSNSCLPPPPSPSSAPRLALSPTSHSAGDPGNPPR